MDGYAFYAELPDQEASKRGFTRKVIKAMADRGDHCNVTAIATQFRHCRHMDGIGAVYDHANSGVASLTVDPAWLRAKTVRIDEVTARKLHPALFSVLDYNP